MRIGNNHGSAGKRFRDHVREIPSVAETLAVARNQLMIVVVLLGISTLGTALRLHDLDARSLSGDELYTAKRVRLDLGSLVKRTAASDDVPPLSYAVTRFFVILLGDSDFAIRLPAALFGSLSIPLVYKVGETLWTRKEGLIGSFLLALNAYHVQFSQFARHYALTVFLALVSLVFLLKALEASRKRLWIGFVISTTLNLYNHYFGLLPLVSEVIFAACIIGAARSSDRQSDDRIEGPDAFARPPSPAKQALMLTFSLASVGLLFLPWLPVMISHLAGPHVGLRGLGGMVASQGHLSVGYLYEWLSSYTGMDGIPLLLLCSLFVLGLWNCSRGHTLLIALWVGMPLLFPLAVRTDRAPAARFAVFVIPVYLLAVARGSLLVGRLSKRLALRTGRNARSIQIVAPTLIVLTVAALSVPPLSQYLRMRREDREDWRSAARYLADTMLPGDAILADGRDYGAGRDHGRVIAGLGRYLRSEGVPRTHFVRVGREVWGDLAHAAHGQADVWAVLWYPNRPASWDTMAQITVVDFQGIPVIRLRQASGDIVQDTVSMLQVLLDLLPPEARFDVHLALGEYYLRTARFDQAEVELDKAGALKPDSPEASQDLADARAEFEDLSSTIENIQHPLWRNLGEVVAFLGYEDHPASVRASGTLDLTLWWQGLASMDTDYTAFIHLVDPQGRIWAQQDRLLQHGDYPTSTWLPGETVKDEYGLQLPPGTPPGEYTVKAGVYYWETGERLPVWDEHGSRAAEDAIVLDSVIVVE